MEDKIKLQNGYVLSKKIVTEPRTRIKKHNPTTNFSWNLDIFSPEPFKNIDLYDDINRGNCVISTISRNDLPQLYHMSVLKWRSGEPKKTIYEISQEIMPEILNNPLIKNVCFLLRFGIQPSLPLPWFEPLQKISEKLQRKKIISNFVLIKTEKLNDTEFQLVILIN